VNKNIKHYIKVTLLTSSILSSLSAHADDRITSITVSGNHRIEQETIKSYLDLNVGQNFTSDKRIDAIKRLYSTSMFENVYIDYNAGRLVVHVVEAPFITKVEIKGNNKIKSATLLKEITTHSGDSLSKTKIHRDVDTMLETYKRSGRFAVTIVPQIKDLGNGKVKVIFEVTEGPKASIRNIYFAGNNNYRTSELSSIILTKETAWYKFMDTNDTYDPERIEYDKEFLKQFYI
jgi:outer membrane protein insertion porin family